MTKYAKYKESNRASYNKHMRKLRSNVVNHLGGVCVRCGFKDPRALAIDHVHGGGMADRKKHGHVAAFYKAVVANKTGKYQLLCANCNCIKRIEEGEHRCK